MCSEFGLTLNGREQTLYGGHFSELSFTSAALLEKETDSTLGVIFDTERTSCFEQLASIVEFCLEADVAGMMMIKDSCTCCRNWSCFGQFILSVWGLQKWQQTHCSYP